MNPSGVNGAWLAGFFSRPVSNGLLFTLMVLKVYPRRRRIRLISRGKIMDRATVSVQMLIRKSPDAVFNAFVDPRLIEKFWLRSASGPLAKGARVEWEFMVPGARETVAVTEFVPGRGIAFTWSGGVAVKMTFDPHDRGSTRLSV